MARSNTKSVKAKNKPVEKQPPKKRGPKKADPMIKFMPVLERYLILGYSLVKCCQLGGLTWSNVDFHYKTNNKFRLAVDGLINAPNVKARANIINDINRGNIDSSKYWLERREREDFATRQENTGKDGEPLTQPIEVVFVRKEK